MRDQIGFPVALSSHEHKISQLTGFEPVRAMPIGFQVQRLNHSATIAGADTGKWIAAYIVSINSDFFLKLILVPLFTLIINPRRSLKKLLSSA